MKNMKLPNNDTRDQWGDFQPGDGEHSDMVLLAKGIALFLLVGAVFSWLVVYHRHVLGYILAVVIGFLAGVLVRALH